MCSPHDGRPTRRPLPQFVLSPAHPSAPGAGDQIKQADRGEPGRGGWAKEGRGYEMDPCRRRCRRSISSSSYPLFRLVPVPAVVSLSHPSSCRLVRRFACSSLVVLPRRSVVVSFYPVGSFSLPVSSTREGEAFFSFDSEVGRASKHEGVAGRGVARGRGVHAMGGSG